MPPPSIQCIEDLKSEDVERLTQTLHLPAGTIASLAWLKDQEACIAELPSRLRRPQTIIPRLAMVLPFTEKAHLCKPHRGLNAHLIRRIFLQISAECTTRLTRLVENPDLPHNIAAFVKRLQTTNSLWMSPDLYRVTFQCMPNDERFDRMPGDCEACILAAIGGNSSILSDLRTSMLGRKRKHGQVARLLRLVEAWIDWAAEEDVVRAVSDSLAKDVRACRRQMQTARRQKRRNLAEGIVETGDLDAPLLQHDAAAAAFEDKEHEQRNEREEREEHDPEGSIIDFYAHRARRDTKVLSDAGNIHPAFRSSLSFHTASRSAILRDSLPARPGNPIAYTESEPSIRGHRGNSARPRQPPPSAHNSHRKYPRNTSFTESIYSAAPFDVWRNSRVNLPTMPVMLPQARRVKSSEEHAAEYQGLLHAEEEASQSEEWRRFDECKTRGANSQQRMTTFTDFMSS
ncbi:unnamed protein product [Diplocarpon coronariae]|uniref:Uncharacterized protein n=1 Tax=Diplocarpon coronariae TaxID=2795749 RepID=A0A218ZFL3_9HELO|nr:hypothetical protein B2J93_1185 [Marssonina coronariae]